MNNNTHLFELRKLQTSFPAVKITSSTDADRFIRQFYSDDIEIFESMYMLMLNNNNMTVGYCKISQGGITGTVVDVRLVAKYAIDCLATGVILAHNHPSGTLNPSIADDKLTAKVKDGLAILDIKLLDHLIMTKETYYSYADEGKI